MAPARGGNNRSSSLSGSPPPPPLPNATGYDNRVRSKKRRQRNRGYSDQRERKKAEVTIVLCVFHGVGGGWRTVPYTFDKYKINDEELWIDIRKLYRNELQKEWRRLLLFKRLKTILPIEFSRNDVPVRQDPKNVPGAHEFNHCYHHPTHVRTNHDWDDWFTEFDATDPDKTYGLEFVEGVWAEKLGVIAIGINIAIIAVSIGWAIKGGDLQTIFTVMGFVITAAAADIALVALYYQVTLPDS